MDLISKKNVKVLLSKYRIRPSKGLGQNFLINKTVLKKIVLAAELKPTDIVLEIGPGPGALTQELAKKTKMVVAIEKDPTLVNILGETLKDFRNVKIIHGDILKLNPIPHTPKPYKVVANLPYYITSPVIRHFLELTGNRPLSMVLMVQKEVGQRITAQPPKMSLLAVSVQFYARPKIVSYVSKNNFWPQPKVDSAILKIRPFLQTGKKQVNPKLFFKIVRAGFSQPRKQLANNLSNGLQLDKAKTEGWLLKNNIQPSQRAQTLSVRGWIALTKSFPFYGKKFQQ